MEFVGIVRGFGIDGVDPWKKLNLSFLALLITSNFVRVVGPIGLLILN
jgi:hypothetical protein